MEDRSVCQVRVHQRPLAVEEMDGWYIAVGPLCNQTIIKQLDRQKGSSFNSLETGGAGAGRPAGSAIKQSRSACPKPPERDVPTDSPADLGIFQTLLRLGAG